MFEDEDIGVHTSQTKHSRTAASANQRRATQTTSTANAATGLPTSSATSYSVPFTSKRRAIQFANRNPHELEGERIEPDSDSNSADDDIDFTPSAVQSEQQREQYVSRQAQPRGRHFRRHPTVEHSPHCQPLERSVNKPFLCISPYTLSGRRVGFGGAEVDDSGGGSEVGRCAQEFGTRQACENHIRSRHTLEKLKCSFPRYGFAHSDVQNLNKHERTHVQSGTLVAQPRTGEGGLRMRSV